MKENTYTQLSLILDHLFIKSKVLASAIHVDASMVSRWRADKRRLNNRSEHYTNIINFILEWDEHMNYQNIAAFLIDYYPDHPYDTRDDIYRAVDMWLSDKNMAQAVQLDHTLIPSPVSALQLNVLNTTTQKKKAMLYLLDVAISLSDNRNLYILLDMFTDKLLNEEDFYNKWIERLTKATSKGVSVYFIYSSYFLSSSIINMENFFKLCFSQNYHAYYMTRASGYPFMLCVLEESFAITNFIHIPNERTSSFFTFSDKNLLFRFQHYYLEQLKNCQSFLNFYNYPTSFFDRMNFDSDPERKICCYDSSLFLFPVPPELFSEILDCNGFDNETKTTIMKRYRSIIYDSFMNADNVFTHNLMLDISEMECTLPDADHITMCPILTDKEIIVPRRFFARYIRYIYDFIRSHMDSDTRPPFDIFLITSSTSTLPRDCSVLTVDSLFAYIHSYSMNKYLMITNPSIASDMYRYIKNIWDELPEENHYTKSSLLLLKRLLNILE